MASELEMQYIILFVDIPFVKKFINPPGNGIYMLEGVTDFTPPKKNGQEQIRRNQPMRLIDADDFERKVMCHSYNEDDDAVYEILYDVCELLRVQPAIEQERTAMLTRTEDEASFDYGVCANCGKMHPDWDSAVMFNYCPECGAKFVKEVQE